MTYEHALTINAYTVGTCAYMAPANRPNISSIIDAASRAAWSIR